MKRRALFTGVLAAMIAAASTAQEEISFKTTELADGLYMIEGVGGFAGGNIGLSIGEDGTVMIDDSMPPLNDKLLAAVGSVTDDDVDFVINTHIHGDHTGGNVQMAEAGAHIVAHENIRKRMLEQGQQTQEGTQPYPKAALPVITFSEEMSFHLNGHHANVIHVMNAHTDGDAMIHYVDANVIHTGDAMFNGRFPYIDLDSGGSVDGYIAAQEKIAAMANEETKIIPGHGPLGTRADIEAMVAMLKDAKSIVAEHIDDGKSADEIVAAEALSKYARYDWGFITQERMIRTIYRDLTE